MRHKCASERIHASAFGSYGQRFGNDENPDGPKVQRKRHGTALCGASQFRGMREIPSTHGDRSQHSGCQREHAAPFGGRQGVHRVSEAAFGQEQQNGQSEIDFETVDRVAHGGRERVHGLRADTAARGVQPQRGEQQEPNAPAPGRKGPVRRVRGDTAGTWSRGERPGRRQEDGAALGCLQGVPVLPRGRGAGEMGRERQHPRQIRVRAPSYSRAKRALAVRGLPDHQGRGHQRPDDWRHERAEHNQPKDVDQHKHDQKEIRPSDHVERPGVGEGGGTDNGLPVLVTEPQSGRDRLAAHSGGMRSEVHARTPAVQGVFVPEVAKDPSVLLRALGFRRNFRHTPDVVRDGGPGARLLQQIEKRDRGRSGRRGGRTETD